MKKIVLIFLISFHLFAYDDYIGLGVGYSQFNIDTSTESLNDNGTSFSLDLGHKYSNYGRFHAVATFVDYKNSVTSAGSYSLGYDFLIPLFHDTFELYLGPVLGYTFYKESEINLNGMHYGAETGVLFKVSNNIELEAGYNFYNQDRSSGIYTAQNTQTAYFQVNFFFNKAKYFKYR
jgi:hypothetical protein